MKKLLLTICLLMICKTGWCASQLKHTVCPSGCDYATLAGAVNHLEAAHANLVTSDVYADIEISGTWSSADTVAVLIHNMTTDATRYINIYTTAEARHEGVWSTSKYIHTNTADTSIGIQIQEDYVTITGLQIAVTLASSASYAGGILCDNGTGVVIRTNIIKLSSGGSALNGIYLKAAATAYNNISYSSGGANDANNNAFRNITTAGNFYNNTAYGCGNGFLGASITPLLKNNISTTNGTADYSCNSGFHANSVDNISTDTSSPNNEWDSTSLANIKFVTDGSDFHLQSGSVAIDGGTDLSATFTDDIDGDTRPTGASTWDIGADELIAAAGGFGAFMIKNIF